MSTIDITQVSKLKHGDLYQAAKKIGSQSALARHLGVRQDEVCDWCNLRKTPPASWPEEKVRELEQKLFDLTGKTWDELFPKELAEAKEFLRSDKTAEKTVSFQAEALLSYAESQAHRLSYNPPEEDMDSEVLKQLIGKALKTLSYREKTILEMRFGIDCEPMTYADVAHAFKVTKERIRQIEMKALRKLQQPTRTEMLSEFAPERTAKLPDYTPPKEVWLSDIYAEPATNSE